jgi:WD40 repeat protein/serine/threonine protein kinase
VVAGRYEIRDLVRGGMGVVYIALDRELDRLVAVKTPSPASLASDEGRARFRREAESWIALGMHPYICTAHYVQEIGGAPRLFIEYVDSGGLDQWLRAHQPTLEQRLDIAIQIAEGMSYTHTFSWTDDEGVRHAGLVHRDLKPANVLMSSDGTARITDFGLVRAHSHDDIPDTGRGEVIDAGALAGTPASATASGSWQTVTRAGGVLGTPPYMAPELWRPSQRATAAADIYAYGCILYELVCHRRPFRLGATSRTRTREAQLTQWLKLHVSQPPPHPTDIAPGLDEQLGALMLSCVAKEPGDRPASFDVIASQLRTVYERVAGRAFPRPRPRHATLLADSLNNRAVSYLTLDRPEMAESCWLAALESEPGHLEATANLALSRWQTGRLNDAELLRLVEQAGHGVGEPERAVLPLGRLHLMLGRAEDAVEALRTVRRASATVHRDLGLALLAQSRGGEAPGLVAEAERALVAAYGSGSADLQCTAGLAYARHRLGKGSEPWSAVAGSSPGLPSEPEQAARLLLPGHETSRMTLLPGRVDSIARHRQRVAVRCSGTTLCVLDVGDPDTVHSLRIPGPARREPSIAFMSPSLAVVDPGHGPLAIWDVEAGTVARQLRPHPGHITALAVDPLNLRALTGGSDRKLRLWDLTSGDCTLTLDGHEAYVAAVAFGADGTTAISSSGDGTGRLWCLDTGTCLRILDGHDGAVTAVVAVADGRWLTAGEDGTVRLWPSAELEPARVLRGHDGPITAAAALSAHAVVCTAGADHTVRSWDLDRGAPLGVIRCRGPVQHIAAGPPEIGLLVGRADRLEAIEEERLIQPSRAPFVLTMPVSTGELSRRRARFDAHISSAREQLDRGRLEEALSDLRRARGVPGYEFHAEALRLWARLMVRFPKRDVRAVAELRSLPSPGGRVVAAVLTPEDDRAVTAGSDGAVRLWDLTTTSEIALLGAHGTAISCLGQNDDGSCVVTSSRDGEIRLWRGADPVTVQNAGPEHVAAAALALLPDSSAVISGGPDGAIRLHPVDIIGQPRLIGSHHEPVMAVECSADGRLVCSAGIDSRVMIWDPDRGTLLHSLAGHEHAITALSFSPDCRRVASADDGGCIRVFDVAGQRCLRTISGHTAGITDLSHSPGGRFLASAGRDGALRLWDVRTGACLRTVEAHTAAVTSVHFSADGSSLLSAGADGCARLWIVDWEPEPRGQEDWDERARPFLEVFLRRHQQDGQPTPEWTDEDFADLLTDLARRGFGWITADRVRRELEGALLGWAERRAAEREHLDREHQRQLLRERAAPIENTFSRLIRNLGLRLAVLILAAAAVGFFIHSVRVPRDPRVELNDTLRPELRLRFEKRSHELAANETLPSFHIEHPEQPDPPCDGEDLTDLLDVLLRPTRHSRTEIDAHRQSGDAEFRSRYRLGLRCVPASADEPTVDALLEQLAAGGHPSRRTDLLGVLVRLDAAAEPILGAALASSEAEIRHAAAEVLVYRATPAARELLRSALLGDDDRAREAAMSVLRELVVSGVIDGQSAFRLIRDTRLSIDPRMRRWGVRALAVYQETDPVREHLDEALDDPDTRVSGEARIVRALIREARLKQLLGQD